MPQASTAQPQRPSAPSGPTTAGSIDALALAAALAGAADSSSGAGSAQQHMQRAPGPSLAEVLTPEVLIPLVSEPGVLERLSAHLPVRPQSALEAATFALPFGKGMLLGRKHAVCDC